MVLLDIASPIFLMVGFAHTTAENASRLNNFEIVATSMISLLIFKERVSKRLWVELVIMAAVTYLASTE